VNARTARIERRSRLALGDYPVAAAWAADGRGILVGGGEGALWWIDATAATPVATVIGRHAGGVLAVATQPGGRLYASSGQDGEVRIGELRSAAGDTAARCIHAASQWSELLAWSANGRMLAVGTGPAARVYAADGTLRCELPSQAGAIAALAWRAKLAELATAGNGGVHLHRVAGAVETREYAWPGACLSASWSPDGRVLASGMQDGSVHYWNIAAGTQSQMRGYGTRVQLTGWNAAGRLLATAAGERIVVWDFSGRGPEGSEPLQLAAHTARLTQLAFQPVGPLLAAGGRDHRLSLWRPGAHPEPLDADLLGDELVLLRWSPDGRRLLAADRAGALYLYSVES
jgi:WD40 repeat protein